MLLDNNKIGGNGNSAAVNVSGHAKIKEKFFTRKRFRPYWGMVWILPAIIIMLIFSYYPPISALIHAFTDWDGTNAKFIGVANFQELFADSLFWRSCLTMVITTVGCMLLGNIMTIIHAEMMYGLRSRKMSAFFRFMYVLPALVPGIVTLMLWGKVILSGSPSGVANVILGVFGVEPIGWFYQESTVILSFFIYGFPYVGGTSFLIYLAGLNNISEEIIEASKLDGISTVKRIFYIDLPLIKGQIKYFLVLGLIGGIQSYTIQYAITNGGPGLNYPSMVPGYYMYMQALNNSRYGYACAVGFVLFVVILVITIINNKFIKTEES